MKMVTPYAPWSCTLDAFAMSLEVSQKELIDLIGHDGSEILWPEEPEPQCRRGFHLQELLVAALKINYCYFRFDFTAKSNPKAPIKIEIPGWSLEDFIQYKNCVIIGQRYNNYHAVAWSGNFIYDSGTQLMYPFHLWRRYHPVEAYVRHQFLS